MPAISSSQNPAVAFARSLAQKKNRLRSGQTLLEGEHMVGEALRTCPERVTALFVEETRMQTYAALIALAPREAAVYAVTERVLAALSTVQTPQGVAATLLLPQPPAPEAMGPRLVLLENVQDPGNVGTVLRTLEAAGFDGCLLTEGCADPFSPKGLRATMGAGLRVPIREVESAPAELEALKARGYAVLAAALDGAPYYDRPAPPERLCLLIGNEGAGLTPESMAAATHCYRLPMRGHAESLNAAVAAAILMYDLQYR